MEILTHTKDVETKPMINRLVNQLVRQTIKSYVSRKRDSTTAFTLKYNEIAVSFSSKYTSVYKPLRPLKWNQLRSPSRDFHRSINHTSILHSSPKQFQKTQIEHFVCHAFEGSPDRITLKCAKHVHKHSCWNEEVKNTRFWKKYAETQVSPYTDNKKNPLCKTMY